MRERWFLAVPLMFLLSSCHGIGQDTYSQRWVNQTDQNQVLMITFQNPSLMGRVHLTFMGRTPQTKGSYTLQTSTESSEGRAALRDGGITLTTPTGSARELNFQDNNTLQEQNGTIWKAEPIEAGELQKSLRSW